MLLNPQDRLDVIELIAHYAQCLDGGDIDGYVGNFLPNGVIEWGGGKATGHEEIRAWVGRLMAGGIGASPARVRHVVGLPSISGDGGRCTAHTYVSIFSLNEAGAIVTASIGSYDDEIVKTPEGWRFAKRAMAADLGVFDRTI